MDWSDVAQRLIEHPGRGGCGVGAAVELSGRATHELVELAVAGLRCMEHRGGCIDDTGDGAGLLVRTHAPFFERFIAPGRQLPPKQRLSVGALFFPAGQAADVPHWQREIEAVLRRHGLLPLGFRRVPTDEAALGALARQSRRDVWHLLIGEGMVAAADLPITFWRVKAALEQRFRELYVASLSPDTLTYKALATGEQLRRYYADLADPYFATDAVIFHRRYSTNTFSNWYLAQVFRVLGHNGEINTIKANRNAVQNLEAELGLMPILMQQGSDSADMDRVVELFLSHGVSLPETLCRMMPMAWKDVPGLSPEVPRFFRGVQRALGPIAAWEGPAAIVAMDGQHLVGALDRMGLRPLRWLQTRSGRFLLGSEIGAIPVPFEDIAATGQLDPGESIAVRLADRKVLEPMALLAEVLAKTPINFGDLSEHRLYPLPRAKAEAPQGGHRKPPSAALNLFGWTLSRTRVVEHLAETGKEPVTSMGYDRPLAVFSAQRPPLSKYFKQIVAVVTNPPIDPIREKGAFDLGVHLGAAPIVHENLPVYDPLPQYKLSSPILTEDQLATMRAATGGDRPKVLDLDCTFEDPAGDAATGAKAISSRIAELCRQGLSAVKRDGANILILSDRRALDAPVEGPPRQPLPMVLMVSALHNTLVDEGRRRHCSLLVDSGEIQEGHDVAVLIANGASAVCPYLAIAVGLPHGPAERLLAGLEDTLQRVMSKMGICSVSGYRASRLFEAVGLSPSLTEHYLPGIPSRMGGIDLEDLYEDVTARRALGAAAPRDADVSVYRKEVWSALQAVARGQDPAAYGRFLGLIAETPPVYLRDLLRLKPAAAPTPLDQVEREEALIASTFRGAAMSLGALHRTAHEAIAAAFNHFGASSNCGEGGEAPERDKGGARQACRSRIRQVASGRFGVDARYLINADELSIKIGQGAKPGEGGMLPASKVTVEIARIRRTQPGVALISPPPHHDIYSIEDLAQLVYNLAQVNPKARISVKIPGVTDIGTIAVGVAKAGADVIDVSGFEGGTGAAVTSSIEHAGLPLERALTETHQALVVNGVRDRVRLRADGGLKTGFDVIAALAMGADEVSLGTALMVAEQCIFCHGCAVGLCPAGITTQSDLVARRLMTEKKGRPKDLLLVDEEAARFEDAKDAVQRYLLALAKDVREKLAALGVRSARELVGRIELLERKPLAEAPFVNRRAAKVDLSELLAIPTGPVGRPAPAAVLPVDRTSELNARLCADARVRASLAYEVRSTDRAIGATLAGQLASGAVRLPEGRVRIALTGYAGQGLGFAMVDGMRLTLEGFANDALGEVMSGGELVLRAPRCLPAETRGALSLCGNAVCYGATGGRVFIEGRAGQRLGVRNSGATVVVEGVGKYAFEYMTGGVGVVLGPVGPVLGSGMTGGVVYALEDGSLAAKVHADAQVVPLAPADEDALHGLLQAHAAETGSHRATALLAEWGQAKARFRRVEPRPAPAA